jgi:UPF0716 protein FxsA
MAKYLLFAVLTLPFLELAVFLAVAATIGFGLALLLLLGTSLAGLLLLRNAGGKYITRARVALAEGQFTSLQAEGAGGFTILAGILLLVPGFITDAAAILLLMSPLRGALARMFTQSGRRGDDVVDLEPENWRREEERDLTRLPNEMRK